MKRFRQALRMDSYRWSCSALFYLTIVLLWGIWIFDEHQELAASTGSVPVLCFFNWRSSASLLAAVPFATSFCEDYRNRFLWYSAQRTGVRAYAWSKTVSTMLCTFLTNLAATMSFVGILCLRFPLVEQTSDYTLAYASIPPYGALLLGDYPLLYFICVATCESLFMALLAAIALTVSCVLPDFFVTLATPIICYYGIINAAQEGIFSPYRIFMTQSIDMGGPLLSILYAAAYALAAMFLVGCVFARLVRRRVVYG